MKKHENIDYFRDILDSIVEIEAFVKGLDFSNFKTDRKTILAVIRDIEVIGEAAKKISRLIRKNYPEIPWKDIAGMRDKLIHGYFGIDLDILWETIRQDLPQLKIHISKLIEEEEEEDSEK